MTTWTPATQQGETWTNEATARVFDPYVFDRAVFDTGSVSGIWDAKAVQSEVWTPKT